MDGQQFATAPSPLWPGERLQPWRVGVVALLVVVHAGLVVWLARPVGHPQRAAPVESVERIRLVVITPDPGPPPSVRRPRRVVDGVVAPPADRAPRPPVVVDAGPEPGPARPDGLGAVSGADPAGAVAPPGTFIRPAADGMPSRGRANARLPGRDIAFVDGVHVRATPSIEDRVLRVAAIFGGRRPETCDEVRQRLVGAGPGLAREMDVERLARLCTD